jgi:hypothetical protein
MSNNPLLRNSIDSSVVTNLMAMGFSKDQVEIALRRASNDPNMAVEYLSQGPLVDDASFDLMANAPPEQSVRAPTVFQPHTGGHEGTDHFVEGITQGSISEMVDARSKSHLYPFILLEWKGNTVVSYFG